MAFGLLRMLCFWGYRNSDGFAELHGMRNVMLWAAACAAATTALGQLPNGSVAPDWTATDLDGNTHHLYSLLDSGYVVIIDFSATWCGPCWSYHNSGALEQVYETYGPDGTNEVRVFFAEGDPATSLDALHGIGGGTAGDWVTGTPYPILHTDGPAMFDAYACSYYPTIYTICPNRLLTQSGQISAAAHGTLATSPTCAPASLPIDVALLDYTGPTAGCPGAGFPLSVRILNQGLEPLTSCTIEATTPGGLTLESTWTGELPTYGIAEVDLGELMPPSTTFLFLDVVSTDGNAANNSLTTTLNVSSLQVPGLVKVALTTDGFPAETSWELRDGAGAIVESVAGADLAANTDYTWWIYAEDLGCYTFALFDAYGDGMAGNLSVTGHSSESAAGTAILSHSGTGTFAVKQKSFSVTSVVGVEEAAEPAWSIVPNPTSGTAVAQLPRGWEAAEVAVLDAAGRQVAQPRPVNGRVELQAADLAPGIYVVRATQGGKVATVRWSVL